MYKRKTLQIANRRDNVKNDLVQRERDLDRQSSNPPSNTNIPGGHNNSGCGPCQGGHVDNPCSGADPCPDWTEFVYDDASNFGLDSSCQLHMRFGPFDDTSAIQVDWIEFYNGSSFDVFDDFERLTDQDFGSVSSDSRPWNTDEVFALTQWGTNGSHAFAATGSLSGHHVYAYVDPDTGDAFTQSPFHFKLRFRLLGLTTADNFFELLILGDNCLVHYQVAMNNDSGFYAVDDAGNSWTASQSKTDWVVGSVEEPNWYIMEGYGDNTVGGKIKVYAEDCRDESCMGSITSQRGGIVGVIDGNTGVAHGGVVLGLRVLGVCVRVDETTYMLPSNGTYVDHVTVDFIQITGWTFTAPDTIILPSPVDSSTHVYATYWP